MLLLLAVALVVGFAPAPFPKRGPRKLEALRLEGTWVMTDGHVDGVPNYSSTSRSAGLSASRGDVVRISTNRLTFPAKGSMVSDWTIRSGAAGVIDLHGPPPARLHLLGIYRLEGDTLTLCVGDQGRGRPTVFAGS